MSVQVDGETNDVKQELHNVRKRQRVPGDKACQVCGDQASAHHFGVLACETCKAFFRRNAQKGQEPRKCLFKDNCPIDKKTRRFCPACRLRKCLDVGMQPDLILDEEQKNERMKKVNEKRLQRKQILELENSNLSSPACIVSTSGNITSPSPENDRMSETATPNPQIHPVKICTSDLNDQWKYESDRSTLMMPEVVSCAENVNDSLPDAVEEACFVTVGTHETQIISDDAQNFTLLNSPLTTTQRTGTESEMTLDLQSYTQSFPTASSLPLPDPSQHNSPAFSYNYHTPENQPPRPQYHFSSTSLHSPSSASLFKHVPRDQLPSDPYMYWRLSEEERSLLTQLSAAYQDTILSILNKNPPRDFMRIEDFTVDRYFAECEVEMRNIISFVKRMEDFQRLRTDDQIAVLKASSAQVLGLRSCALYVAEKDAWLSRLGYVSTQLTTDLFPDYPYSEFLFNHCRYIKSLVKNDVTLYALLHCVVVFDPSDHRIIDRQMVNSIRDKYIILLRHYLESVYSFRHSERYFMALQERLMQYRDYAIECKPFFKKFFPHVPSQLIAEVLDLDY